MSKAKVIVQISKISKFNQSVKPQQQGPFNPNGQGSSAKSPSCAWSP